MNVLPNNKSAAYIVKPLNRRVFGTRATSSVLAVLLLFFAAPICGVYRQSIAVSASTSMRTSAVSRAITNTDDVYFDADARKVIQPTVLAGEKLSATSIGDVLTLLFDGAKISLQHENEPMTASWVGSIRVPTKNTGKRSYLQHLRGFIQKDKDARIIIILDLGETSHTISFPYGMAIKKDLFRELYSIIKLNSHSYTATILIIAERQSAKSALMVSLDSIDVEAKARRKK
jgi:hypothetical protein